MSKKKVRKSKSPAPAPSAKRHRQRKRLIVVSLILLLSLSGIILAQWRSLRTAYIAPSPVAPAAPAPPTLQASQPSKAYIYAGGRLVAIEEPTTAPDSSLAATCT